MSRFNPFKNVRPIANIFDPPKDPLFWSNPKNIATWATTMASATGLNQAKVAPIIGKDGRASIPLTILSRVPAAPFTGLSTALGFGTVWPAAKVMMSGGGNALQTLAEGVAQGGAAGVGLDALSFLTLTGVGAAAARYGDGSMRTALRRLPKQISLPGNLASKGLDQGYSAMDYLAKTHPGVMSEISMNRLARQIDAGTFVPLPAPPSPKMTALERLLSPSAAKAFDDVDNFLATQVVKKTSSALWAWNAVHRRRAYGSLAWG